MRERALELVDDAIERIEAGSTMPDTQDVMAYALILMLADIYEVLKGIESTLDRMHEYRTGMDAIKGV